MKWMRTAVWMVLLSFGLMGFWGDCSNNPPELNDVEDVVMTAGTSLTIELLAADPDGDDLTFYAQNLPPDAIFDEEDGIFEFSPSFFTLGIYNVTFGVTDGDLTDELEVRIQVYADTDFEAIEIVPGALSLLAGEAFQLQANGIREGGEVVEGIYVNFETSDAEVAGVNFAGLVSAASAGTATINAWLVQPDELFTSIEVVVGMDLMIVNGVSPTISLFDTANDNAVLDAGVTTGLYPNGLSVRGDRAFVILSGDNAVKIFDTKALVELATIDLAGVAENPWDIEFVSDEKAYVSGLVTSTLAIVNPTTGAVTGTVALPAVDDIPAKPTGLELVGDKLFIACNHVEGWSTYGDGLVMVLDTVTDTLIDTDGDDSNGVTPIVTSQKNAGDLALASSGYLFVICAGDWSFLPGSFSMADVIDPVTYEIVATGSFGDYTTANTATAAPNGKVYFGEGIAPWLYSMDGDTFDVLRSFGLGNQITVPNAGGFAYPSKLKFKDGVAFGVEFNSDHLFAFELVGDNDVDPVIFTKEIRLGDEENHPGTQFINFIE